MIDIIRSDERGTSKLDWLDSRHTFSFADYYDPERISFGSLRVVNEDWIEAGKGFGMHPHRDMEIITYMLQGELRHEDSMGNGSVIRPGELQRMTAGTGVLHSEFNSSDTETAHLLQIWILPEAQNLQPGYEQKSFAANDMRNRWRLLGSRDGRDGSLTIHQDIAVYEAQLDESREVDVALDDGRRAFVQVVDGEVSLGDTRLLGGDAVTLDGNDAQQPTTLSAARDTRLLLFDMA